MYLDHEMARQAGGTYEDTEGLINLPLTVKEIQAVVFFKQAEGDEYRVSMRSKGDIDIGAVAKEFGGGGHKNAAGCTVTGSASTRCRRSSSRRSKKPSMDGLLIIDKPAGPTSHDVVARVRRALGERRIGHTGTLDPAATGVLPLVLGRATRLARFLSASDKSYDAVVRLGVATDTDDAEGTPAGPVYQGPLPVARGDRSGARRFRGTFLQQPPAYSAKKIDGRAQLRAARARRRVKRYVSLAPGPLPCLPFPPCPAPVTRRPRTAIDLIARRRRPGDAARRLLRRLLRALAGARPRGAARHRRAPRSACAARAAATSRSTRRSRSTRSSATRPRAVARGGPAVADAAGAVRRSR